MTIDDDREPYGTPMKVIESLESEGDEAGQGASMELEVWEMKWEEGEVEATKGIYVVTGEDYRITRLP